MEGLPWFSYEEMNAGIRIMIIEMRKKCWKWDTLNVQKNWVWGMIVCREDLENSRTISFKFSATRSIIQQLIVSGK